MARGLLPLHQLISEAQAGFTAGDGPTTSQVLVPMEVEGTVRGSLVIQVQLLSSGRALTVAKQAVSAMRLLSRETAANKMEEEGAGQEAGRV